jgi:hypothetical protein
MFVCVCVCVCVCVIVCNQKGTNCWSSECRSSDQLSNAFLSKLKIKVTALYGNRPSTHPPNFVSHAINSAAKTVDQSRTLDEMKWLSWYMNSNRWILAADAVENTSSRQLLTRLRRQPSRQTPAHANDWHAATGQAVDSKDLVNKRVAGALGHLLNTMSRRVANLSNGWAFAPLWIMTY